MQTVRSSPVYDVVVIGSGAGGGTMVKVLTDLGVNVALIEAGPMLNPAKDYKEHMWPSQLDHRGAEEGGATYFGKGKAFGYFLAPNGYWQIVGEPYTVAPVNQFNWFRSRILGGRTNHYGRISLRFADYDFAPYSRDGLGTDWPISYDDIAPITTRQRASSGSTGARRGYATLRVEFSRPARPPPATEPWYSAPRKS